MFEALVEDADPLALGHPPLLIASEDVGGVDAEPAAHEACVDVGCDALEVGIDLGVATHDLRHVLVLGRVTSGPGGDDIIAGARDVFEVEFPDLAPGKRQAALRYELQLLRREHA